MADKINVKFGSGATYGIGTILAIVISWTMHKAIGWAIVHGILSWIYVIYYLFKYDDWVLF